MTMTTRTRTRTRMRMRTTMKMKTTMPALTKEILRADDSRQAPDVASDRVPATDAEPEGSLDRVKSGPLGIQQIEDLEDDAKGG
jgi:hypothetical protein